QWADDARTVLDAVRSERAVLLGTGDGGPITILFAVSHPHRTRGLILANTAASFNLADDSAESVRLWDSRVRDQAGIEEFAAQAWGTPTLAEFAFPDEARDPAFLRWALLSLRLSYNRRDASALFAAQSRVDVRSALGSVRVPTLVL